MTGARTTSEPFRVGDRLVDPASGEITRDGEILRVEPRVMAVLAYLAERPGQVVSKDDLLAAVWPGTFVTDDAVWRCLADLRRALGDDARSPRFIETLPRRGYRLVASVSHREPAGAGASTTATAPAEPARSTSDRPAASPAPPTGATAPPAPAPRRRIGLWAAAAILTLAGIAAVFVAARVRGPAPGETEGRGIAATRPLLPPPAGEAGSPRTAEAFYRLGYGYYRQGGHPNFDRAIELFRRAIALDPQYALAYSGLADAIALRCSLEGLDEACLAPARQAAARALELAPTQAEGHKAMAVVDQLGGDLIAAREGYRRALELRPSYFGAAVNLAIVAGETGELATALGTLQALEPETASGSQARHTNLAWVHYLLGDLAQARREAQAALQLEPFAIASTWLLARIEILEGHLGAARERSRRALEVHPDSWLCLHTAGEVELLSGDPAEARPLLERSWQLASTTDEPELLLDLATALTAAGEREEGGRRARQLISAAEAAAARGTLRSRLAAAAAGAHALHGRRDDALQALERAAELGFRDHRWLAAHPAFASLRSAPRYRALRDELLALVEQQRRSGQLGARSR